MFCIQCGVQLADTEKKCPLCATAVYHPDLPQSHTAPLYPKIPVRPGKTGRRAINGAILIIFLIPLAITFFSDLQTNGTLDWFWYVVGALALGYITLALPLWFRKPNPVIFVPCGFAAATLYLLYIDLSTGGGWFLPFAFPAAGALCIIVCTLVTLLYYIRGSRLYIWGGVIIALGAYMILLEFLLGLAFHLPFTGWSVYPLAVLALFGGLLIYLAINQSAREMMERKLFF